MRGDLSPLVALNFVKGLLHLLRECGYAGLLWVIDEVETVQRLPLERQRLNSYESLRVLVDQIAENALPGLLLLITGTPRLFEDHRYGVPSYPPLEQRLQEVSLPDGSRSVRQPLVTLGGLGREDLLEVAKKIREIHGQALAWNSAERLTDDHLAKLVEMAINVFGGCVERTPRTFLREVVHLCDVLSDHPSLSADAYFKDDTVLAVRLVAPGSQLVNPRRNSD